MDIFTPPVLQFTPQSHFVQTADLFLPFFGLVVLVLKEFHTAFEFVPPRPEFLILLDFVKPLPGSEEPFLTQNSSPQIPGVRSVPFDGSNKPSDHGLGNEEL